MTLPNFILPDKVNKTWKSSGMDSLERCLDKKHFTSYPHDITYQYNSRGFRDAEWPVNTEELQSAIWCVGDSFTVGIGSPLTHIWPQMLAHQSLSRTINISMDGASNNWIARQAVHILRTVKPQALVIHWSYLHRREGFSNQVSSQQETQFLMLYDKVKDPSWPSLTKIKNFSQLPAHVQHELLTQHDPGWRIGHTDEQLRAWHILSDLDNDINNTVDCMGLVDLANLNSCVIHSFIPNFCPCQSEMYASLPISYKLIKAFDQLDLARDGHHYDIKTSQYFVQQILLHLN